MGVPPEFLDAVAVPFADHPHGLVLRGRARGGRSARRLRLSDLADETFLVREPGSGTRAVMERYLRERDRSRRASDADDRQRGDQAGGDGRARRRVSCRCTRSGSSAVSASCYVPTMPGLPVVRRWHVVHRRGKQLLPIAQAFSDFVRDDGGRYAEASSSPPRRVIRKPARSATIVPSVAPM